MNILKLSILILSSLAILSCNEAKMTENQSNINMDKLLSAEKKITIFFGHQSVGNNILDGVRAITKERKLPITIINVSTKQPIIRDGINILQKEIGQNGDPITKIKDFELSLDRLEDKNNINIAMMKLCFIDFNKHTDVRKIFNEYKNTINQLKNKYKNTTFIHITTPLVENNKTYKYYIKKLIGKEISNEITNKIRMEYNNLILKEYDNKYVFNLAYIESVPEHKNKNYNLSEYKLRDEYTSDGGHLNNKGKIIVATKLLSFLNKLKLNQYDKK